MEQWINTYANNTKFLLIGDVNINYNSNELYLNLLKNILTIVGIDQLVAEPTRVTKYSRQ
mgnify:CR=1 FL=1